MSTATIATPSLWYHSPSPSASPSPSLSLSLSLCVYHISLSLYLSLTLSTNLSFIIHIFSYLDPWIYSSIYEEVNIMFLRSTVQLV
jgi:hypothetical protein